MKDSEARKREFANKLARLRRETPRPATDSSVDSLPLGPSDGPASRKTPSIPIWVRKRLQARQAAQTSKANAHAGRESCEVPRWTGRPEPLSCSADGSFWYRRRVYPLEYVHGDWALHQALGVSNDNFVLLSGDKTLAELHVPSAVFLDTETTGLSGGAGVFVYMVGLASFTPEGLEVWQGFMDGPEQEAALLIEVAQRIERSGGVVSFFGKSFDRHRLQDKMALHGIVSPFDDRPHLDLYHPLRRLHRDVYANSRLQTMERALCGLVRPDDLPGSLAPEAWFDYLGGRPHRLEGVFRHNRDDVLSLVTLLAWLAQVDQRDPTQHSIQAETARELALGEALLGNKQVESALHRTQSFLANVSIDASRDPHATQELWLLQAELLRRLRRGPEALASLQPVLEIPGVHVGGVRARALASKILERELGNAEGALRMCYETRRQLDQLRAFSGRLALEREVAKRASRLSKANEPPR